MNWPDDYINKIICGDCLEVMAGIPDGSVDLVLTDPPYGKQWVRKGGFGFSKHTSEKVGADYWDTDKPTAECFNRIQQASHNQIIFGGNYFALAPSNCWIVWDKFGTQPNGTPFADCELAWTSFNTVVKRYVFRQCGFIRDTKDERVHPTQKPSELFSKILQDYSRPGDLILDPFCGSGTTCVAAKMLGRRYIGIDISEEYCEISRQRLRAVDTGVPVKEQRQGQKALFEEQA